MRRRRMGFTMDNLSHNDLGPASDPHADHKVSGMHGSHDCHAGHCVAMFRDKFWLSFVLTIPVVPLPGVQSHQIGSSGLPRGELSQAISTREFCSSRWDSAQQ
jgi:hypothetical protein